MTNDEELHWIDAWNGAFGIPPDSLTAQHMKARAEAVKCEQDDEARQRVAARLAAAELDREWYGSMPSDKPGIERAIAARKSALNFTYSVAEGVTREDLERAIRSLKIAHLVNLVGPTPTNVKPAISGLLVTAGERRGLTQPAE